MTVEGYIKFWLANGVEVARGGGGWENACEVVDAIPDEGISSEQFSVYVAYGGYDKDDDEFHPDDVRLGVQNTLDWFEERDGGGGAADAEARNDGALAPFYHSITTCLRTSTTTSTPLAARRSPPRLLPPLPSDGR